MKGYLARPDGDAPCPAVIVFQEIFGVDESLRRIADLLASSGYAAVVPALFHRSDPDFLAQHDDDGRKRGLAAAAAETPELMEADLRATIAWLQKQPFCNGAIGTWGFCWGGTVAYLSATLDGVSAVCSFYGGQIGKSRFPGAPPMIERTNAIKAPILLSFGGKDDSIPADEIAKIKAALDDAGKTYELHVYPDEGHGYFRSYVGQNATPGSREVWPIVQAFFSKHLRAGVPA